MTENTLKVHPDFDIEFARKWVAALESGEYKQTKEKLISGNGQSFCCLGVACKIDGGFITGRWESDNGLYFRRKGSKSNEKCSGLPDYEITHKLGLHNDFSGELSSSHYAELNDTQGLSFIEIATKYKENLAKAGITL